MSVDSSMAVGSSSATNLGQAIMLTPASRPVPSLARGLYQVNPVIKLASLLDLYSGNIGAAQSGRVGHDNSLVTEL